MKKLILLCLLVIGLLLVGCATEDVNEDLTGLVPEGLPADILEEDLDNIESQTDFPEEDGALAGQATGVPGTASISPNELEKGDALTITTSPSEAGFFDRAILYKGGKYFENFLICDNVVNRRCKDSAETSYTIPLNWVAGDYVLKVYDWATHKFIEFNFKVIAGEDNVFEPAEFKVMPASVKPGDSIRILANPKSTTYYWRAMFYKDNKYISAAPKRFCSNFNCGDSGMIIYEVPSNWAGEYKARMYYKNEQGKWTVEMKNFSVEGEPECYNSSDCPESTISEPYCNAQGQACDDSINYVCSNAGTTEASCEAEQKICENCNDGCIDGTCLDARCTDPDGKNNFYIKGITGPDLYSNVKTDQCVFIGNGTIEEGSPPYQSCEGPTCGVDDGYCIKNDDGSYNIGVTTKICPDGCEDGACLESSTEVELSSCGIPEEGWQPGTTYVLTEDLQVDANLYDCFTIHVHTGQNAEYSAITLDCQGHSIVGNNGGKGIFLNGVIGATVKNCNVTNFYDGISSISSSNSNLIDNVVSQNRRSGIWLSSYHNNLINNVASYNERNGIWISGSGSNNLINNTVIWNEENGIYSDSGAFNKLTNNIAKWNGKMGISLYKSNGFKLFGNVACYNNQNGLNLTDFRCQHNVNLDSGADNVFGSVAACANSNSVHIWPTEEDYTACN